MHARSSGGTLNKLSHRNAILAFLAILILSVLLAFSVGRYAISPWELCRILLSRILPIERTWAAEKETVVFLIRMPRLFLSMVIGAALAVSGLVMQTIFRNPMVSQDVLGTSSGSAFGASLALLWGMNYLEVSLMAFILGTCATLLVTLLSARMRNNQVLGLILGGIMISSLFSSATSFVKLVADTENTLPAITYWMMGSLSSYRTSDLVLATAVMIVAAIPLVLLSWRLNLLTLNEDEARSLGINTKAMRLAAVLCSTLLTAASVAVSGQIGWIGLVIPHFTRMLAGNDTRTTVPLSMILGASFLTIVDTISRTVATIEIPLGILTSFVGAPFFLYLILREGRKDEA